MFLSYDIFFDFDTLKSLNTIIKHSVAFYINLRSTFKQINFNQ